jgi:polar amino acid transport system substrate-binding protein
MRMRALLRCLPLLVLGGLLIGGAGCGGEKKDRPLRWGADEEGGAPYISRAKDGTYVGFEVDIAQALAKEIGRPIEYTPKAFKSLVDDLNRGDIDLAMNGLEVTPDRQQIVLLSRPYYVYRLQLVTRKGDDRFTKLADLEGKKDIKVATLENTAASRLLTKLGIPTKTYDDQVNPYNELADKVVDAVLLDLPIAIYVVKKNPALNEKLQFTGPPIEKGYYAIAFRKDSDALAKQFNEALGRLEKSGQLKQILEKWELWNDDQKELADANPSPAPKK